MLFFKGNDSVAENVLERIIFETASFYNVSVTFQVTVSKTELKLTKIPKKSIDF